MHRQPWYQEINPPRRGATEQEVSDFARCARVCVCVLSRDVMCAWEKKHNRVQCGQPHLFLANPTWPWGDFSLKRKGWYGGTRHVWNTHPQCELTVQQFSAFVWKYGHHTTNKQRAVSQHWLPWYSHLFISHGRSCSLASLYQFGTFFSAGVRINSVIILFSGTLYLIKWESWQILTNLTENRENSELGRIH